MNTATKHLITLTKAPNAKGTFEGIIDANPPEGDKDGERIASWTNLPDDFILGYQHAYGDPGAQIGSAYVTSKGDDRHLLVYGRLDLSSSMARAIHERMLLPSTDSMALKEMSVGFDYDATSVQKDANGVGVIENASLHEVSIVYRGAQSTAISSVKTEAKESTEARTLRNHMDSSHAQGVRAFKPPLADLIIRHRILHADLAPVSERHLTSGVPDGGTIPVTPTRTRSKSRASVEAYVQAARDAAAHDKLVERANNAISAKLEADAMSAPLQEWREADAQREAWAIEKERAIQEHRAAEREQEAADRDSQVQAMEDFRAMQNERDRKAVEDLLSQEGPSFTMKLGPNGQLEDPS
jgi:HK97 family phage prohead protease